MIPSSTPVVVTVEANMLVGEERWVAVKGGEWPLEETAWA